MTKLLLLLTLIACTGLVGYQTTLAADHSPRLGPLFVRTLAGDSLNIVRAEKSAYIFVGGYTCKECITSLERAVLQFDSTYKIHVILRCTPGTRVSNKKSEIQRVAKLLESDSFYFDVGPRLGLGKFSGGLFELFEISITPSLLFNFPDQDFKFINYTELFGRSAEYVATEDNVERCAQVIAKILEVE